MCVPIQVAKLCVRSRLPLEERDRQYKRKAAHVVDVGPRAKARSRIEARSTPANLPDATSARRIPGLHGFSSLVPLQLSQSLAQVVVAAVELAEPVLEEAMGAVAAGVVGVGVRVGVGLGVEVGVAGAGVGTGAENE